MQVWCKFGSKFSIANTGNSGPGNRSLVSIYVHRCINAWRDVTSQGHNAHGHNAHEVSWRHAYEGHTGAIGLGVLPHTGKVDLPGELPRIPCVCTGTLSHTCASHLEEMCISIRVEDMEQRTCSATRGSSLKYLYDDEPSGGVLVCYSSSRNFLNVISIIPES